MTIRIIKPTLSLLGIAVIAANAHAAGFQLAETSAALLGTAWAGSGVTDNAAVAFYNPAAMTFIDKPVVAASGIEIFPHVTFSPVSATNYLGQPFTGDFKSPETNAFLPSFFGVYPINDRLAVGLSTTVPFGLATIYNPNNIARYFATESEIQTINISPSVGIKVLPYLSFGAGLDIMYFKAELNQAFNYTSLNPFPQEAPGDVFITNKANDWGLGWNVGGYWQPTSTTKVGLGYHSKVTINANGNMHMFDIPLDVPSQVKAGFLGLMPRYADTSVDLPDYVILSIKQQINPKWAVMADGEYVHWNTIKSITIYYTGNPENVDPAFATFAPATIITNYRNTWKGTVGTEYQLTNKILLRAGAGYDESPVRNNLRDPRLPDGNRVLLGVGGNYKLFEDADVDVGYQHVFFENVGINDSLVTPVGTATLVANYKTGVDIVGAQLNLHFGA